MLPAEVVNVTRPPLRVSSELTRRAGKILVLLLRQGDDHDYHRLV